jgi:hypothetical protein
MAPVVFVGRRKVKLTHVQGFKDLISAMVLLDSMEAVVVVGGLINEAGGLEEITGRMSFG